MANQRPYINHVTLNNQSDHKSLRQDGRGLVYKRKFVAIQVFNFVQKNHRERFVAVNA